MKFRKALHAPLIQAAADGDWEMARSIQVTPSDFDGESHHTGVLIARPHATGWFISARCRRGLRADELTRFKEFAARNAYLLLQEGPHTGPWAQGKSDQEWRAYSGLDTRDSVEQVPEVIPSQWQRPQAA